MADTLTIAHIEYMLSHNLNACGHCTFPISRIGETITLREIVVELLELKRRQQLERDLDKLREETPTRRAIKL